MYERPKEEGECHKVARVGLDKSFFKIVPTMLFPNSRKLNQ